MLNSGVEVSQYKDIVRAVRHDIQLLVVIARGLGVAPGELADTSSEGRKPWVEK